MLDFVYPYYNSEYYSLLNISQKANSPCFIITVTMETNRHVWQHFIAKLIGLLIVAEKERNIMHQQWMNNKSHIPKAVKSSLWEWQHDCAICGVVDYYVSNKHWSNSMISASRSLELSRQRRKCDQLDTVIFNTQAADCMQSSRSFLIGNYSNHSAPRLKCAL